MFASPISEVLLVIPVFFAGYPVLASALVAVGFVLVLAGGRPRALSGQVPRAAMTVRAGLREKRQKAGRNSLGH